MGAKEVERRNTHEAMTEGFDFETAHPFWSSRLVVVGVVS